jgi:large subunit ribosomal protein L13
MVPRGPLGRQQMRNLRIFKGPDHPHVAQSPEVLDVAGMNLKNTIGRTGSTTAAAPEASNTTGAA